MTDHDDVIDSLRRARPDDLPDEVVSPHAPAAQALLEEILSMQTTQLPVTDNGDHAPVVRHLRPRPRRMILVGAVAAAAAAVVASASVVLAPAQPSEAATVEAALAKSSTALNLSGRAEVTWSQTSADADGTVVYDDGGVFLWTYSGDDHSNTILQWVLGQREPSDEFHEENRWVDGEIYMFFDDADLDEREQGEYRWFRSSDKDNPPSGPKAVLEEIQPVGDFEEVGTETIDGVATRRLRAKHPEAIPPMPALGYSDYDIEGVPVDEVTKLEVWVDDEGIVRRIDIVVYNEFPAPPEDAEGFASRSNRTDTKSIRFYDIGEPITVEAPPDAENLPLFP